MSEINFSFQTGTPLETMTNLTEFLKAILRPGTIVLHPGRE